MSTRTSCLCSFAFVSLVACGGSTLPADEPVGVEPPPDAPLAPEAEAPTAEAPTDPAPAAAPETAEAPAAPEPAPPPAAPEPAEPVPEPEPEPEAPAAAGLPGANINIGSMTVDGVTVNDLSCKMAGGGLGGLFGSLTLAAAFGKKKAQLDACATGKVETTVHWTQSGGRISAIEARSDDKKRNACVERALKGAPAAQDAECLGTVVHGK